MNRKTGLRKDPCDTEQVWEYRADSEIFTLSISLCYVSFNMEDRGDLAKTS
jgi:hypothetical protein